ncbi:MAG: 1-acyl-sn-glycerol-3-phosphate acyltransferase [Bacteroidaceae bacterium]|nr:1-acyl-sn-glycerol-3-phosphate acyltransferase [Bacteroidaceae bacterium]
MNIPAEFDDIRPYIPEELPGVFDELEQDEHFKSVVAQVMPGIPFAAIMQKARACHSLLDFQKAFSYDLMQMLMTRFTDGTDMDINDLDKTKNYTFISNHRDIVLDSAFLSKLLLDNGFTNTVEIAIGDNLLSLPWVKKLVRLNKAFKVKRSVHGREKLLASMQLGRYIHFAVKEKKENIWIAQRQGRAKTSDDRTQESVLKMMAFGGEGSIKERLKEINIVPLSISYEFDPCDFLKARELQEKRSNPDFKKRENEDNISMQTGIMGYKGHVHYQACACINHWLDEQPDDLPKNDLIALVARHIDHEIHSHYRLYANNYIAYDQLNQTERFTQLYTPEEEKRFNDYLRGQIAKIDLPQPDHDFLTRSILEMYANPLLNYLKAAEINEQ